MSITDELRKEARGFGRYVYTAPQADCLTAIAERIDEAHKHAIAYVDDRDPETMAEHGWVKLPLDADGVPIHVGDVMCNTHKDGFMAKRVTGLCLHSGGRWTAQVDEGRLRWHDADKLHHHVTVEDVLREFASDIADVLGGDDFRLDGSDELFAEYAAKLRLAGDGE